MTLENLIIILVIFVLFLFGATLLQFITFLYYSFNYTAFKLIDRESVDEDVLAILEPLEDFLLSKGFTFKAMIEHESSIVGNSQTYHIAYYYNDANEVHAFVKTQPHRGALEAATIVYKTFYENGKRVETVNGMKHFIQVSPANVALYDHYLVENEAIYLAHLQDREQEQSPIDKKPFTQENIVVYKTKDEKEYIQSWEDAGLIRCNKEGYRFLFSWAAWKFAKQSAKGQRSYAKILRERKKVSQGGESQALMAQLEEMGKPRGKSNKKLWFIISMVAFVVLFGFLGLSLADIVILVVVLLVHELGHYLAMRYYGYTDTSIFFLPFGAAAVGKKEHRKAYEEYMVFLAGPLPGIVIGIVILIWSLWQRHSISGESHLIMYAMISLVINYINLLPIYPLDGGRILQLLLLHRYPKGQFYFYMVSLLVLVVAMIWLQDPILLIFVGIVALGVKQSYRISQFLSKLFTRYTPTRLSRETVVEQIVKDKSYSSETLHTKANLAKQILHIVQTSKPSRWLVGFGMLFYLLFLLPPFGIQYAMSYNFIPSEYAKLPKEAQKKLDVFYAKKSSYEGLKYNAVENYTLGESMKILEKYLYNKDANRTVGKALVRTEETNLSDIPKALQKLYAWHNGITQLLPDSDLFSLKKLQSNHLDLIKDVQEYRDVNFTTRYRIFISDYGYEGLAYHLDKEGIYSYSPYNGSSENIKRYYSMNHMLKITAEAYKAGIYYYDYGELSVDKSRFSALKRVYFSVEDRERYEAYILYLQERATAFKDSSHVYVKKEILRALAEVNDSRMITYIENYLNDKNKKVRQQVVHSLGVLGDREVIPLLMQQLEDDPMHCQGCALSGLSYLVNKQDVTLLGKIYPALDEGKMWIRRNAYRVMGHIASPDSLPLLKQNFKMEKPACKLAIVEAFGRIGDKEALPLLKAYLQKIEEMDFSVSYEGRSRAKNPHPDSLKYAVEKAINILERND